MSEERGTTMGEERTVDISEEVRTRAWEAFTALEGEEYDLEGCIDATLKAVAPLIVIAYLRKMGARKREEALASHPYLSRSVSGTLAVLEREANKLEGK